MTKRGITAPHVSISDNSRYKRAGNSIRPVLISTAAIRPAARKTRTHSRKQIGQIADSIRAFGWTNPILIDDRNTVVAGHGRLEAAKLLGMTEVPAIQLSHLSPAERRAYAIADNKLAELAGWDRELLTLELGELAAMDLSFELEITGFEMGEIDLMLGRDMPSPSPSEPSIPDVPKTPVSRAGDLWLSVIKVFETRESVI